MRPLEYMNLIKSISLVFCLAVITLSCNKEEEEDTASNCEEASKDKTDYTDLEITAGISADVFERQYNVSVSQLNEGIDINCDGTPDFRIASETDADYFDNTTTSEALLTILIENSNLSILAQEVSDTVFTYSTVDTLGSTIYTASITSSTGVTGATVASVTENTYVKGLQMGDVIQVTDDRWKSSPVRMRYAKNITTTYSFGPDDNGYYEEAETVNLAKLGLVDSEFNYIAFKYESKKGTKIGYVKLDVTASGSYTYATFDFIRMHR